MENFCDFITNPDWWSVIATFVAAFVAAVITYVLGKRQNELQQQQLKLQERQNDLQEQQARQQEYDVYRRLYSIVRKINNLANNIVININDHLSYKEFYVSFESYIKEVLEYINRIESELDECSIDFELKFSKEQNDYVYCLQLLTSTRLLVQLFENIHLRGGIQFIQETGVNPIIEQRRGSTNVVIDSILKKVASDCNKQAIRTSLEGYILARKHILDMRIVEKIKERITPIYTK